VFVLQDHNLHRESILLERVVEGEVLILVSKSSKPLVSDVVSKMYKGVNLEQVLENVMSEYNESSPACATIYSSLGKNLVAKVQGDVQAKEQNKALKEMPNSKSSNKLCVVL